MFSYKETFNTHISKSDHFIDNKINVYQLPFLSAESPAALISLQQK